MIKYLQIEGFKSLKRNYFSFENLNLLFGMNGMGKSSVIQSLNLLRQSWWNKHGNNAQFLRTNGELTTLGKWKDILGFNANDSKIRFYLTFDGGIEYDFIFHTEDTFSDEIPSVTSTSWPESLKDQTLFSNKFCYLGAEHLSPQKLYSLESWSGDQLNPLGKSGEYAVPYLNKNGAYSVPELMKHPKSPDGNLINNISAWLSEISPETKIKIEPVLVNEIAKLSFNHPVQQEGTVIPSPDFLPVNVGFGIPYVLPLLLALLTSNENSLLLLENPESHMHPKAQVTLGKLLVAAATNGAQIICESHSDHLINGIRVAVKENKIENTKVTLNFFSKDAGGNTEVTNIKIDNKGELSEYPIGLLDEWGDLMSKLISWN